MESISIQIPDETLKLAAERGMDEFIKVFTDKYQEITGSTIGEDTMHLLNGYQHSLLGYQLFREEVMTGGFVQLIQNGYGPYIFENPFAKAMRLFGAVGFSKLLYKAKDIYDEHKIELEKDCTDEEFMAKYEQYEQFDDLEEEFMELEESITTVIAEYVDNHLEEFAEITK